MVALRANDNQTFPYTQSKWKKFFPRTVWVRSFKSLPCTGGPQIVLILGQRGTAQLRKLH